MTVSTIFMVVFIAVLAILVSLHFLVRKNGEDHRLTPLAGMAFVFILAGIPFEKERWIGYSLFGIGIMIAVMDIFNKIRRR